MIPVETALTRILDPMAPVPHETVPLATAAGRVLARPVLARVSQPAAALSAMDGYAVRAEDVIEPGAKLTLSGRIIAGQTPPAALQPGETMRIFTGALLPDGADTVIPQEDTRTVEDGRIHMREASQSGRHVRPEGRDFSTGATLIEAGTRLTPAHVALAAAGGWPVLAVHRNPRVAILATGDELVRAGDPLSPVQTVASSLDGLVAALRAWGADPVDLGIARDDEDELAEALGRARGADLLITLGGASVGEHDLVQDALVQDGFDIGFWKIAMRPGKPLMFGTRDDHSVIGLPGNPVSALVCAMVFVKPAIAALAGRAPEPPETRAARLGKALPANGPRQDYLRARLVSDADLLIALPFELQDSAMLSTLAASDALLVRPPHAPAAALGDIVTVMPLRSLLAP